MALAFRSINQHDQAHKYTQEPLNIFKNTLPADHPNIMKARQSLNT